VSRYDCRRCDWRPEDTDTPRVDLLEHAAETSHPVCVVCGLSLEQAELQTCTACVAATRRRLAEIVEHYALLPGELGHPTAAPLDATGGHHDDETSLPGGSVLALLADGSEGRFWRGPDFVDQLAHTPWRRVRPVRNATPHRPTIAAEGNDNYPSDPPSVAFELSRWEDVLREARNEPVAMTDATVSGAVAYLTPVVGWAADYHPAFDEFAADVRALHRKVEDAVGASTRPQIGVPCFEDGCGVNLIRQYGEDTYRCPRCRREYDNASYWLAVRDEIEAEERRKTEQKAVP
jgi:hypothetical protein